MSSSAEQQVLALYHHFSEFLHVSDFLFLLDPSESVAHDGDQQVQHDQWIDHGGEEENNPLKGPVGIRFEGTEVQQIGDRYIMRERLRTIVAVGSASSYSNGTQYIIHHDKVDQCEGVRRVGKQDQKRGHIFDHLA